MNIYFKISLLLYVFSLNPLLGNKHTKVDGTTSWLPSQNSWQKPENAFSQHQVAKKSVIAFDQDDVCILPKQKTRIFFQLIGFLLVKKPLILTSVLFNLTDVKKIFNEARQHESGTSNIIHAIIMKFKEKGYGDLSSLEEELVYRSTQGVPNKPVIKLIQQLKAQGHTLIVATNQDTTHHEFFRKKMQEHGIDYTKLFDGCVTIKSYKEPRTGNISRVQQKWFATEHQKPSPAYFDAVLQLSSQLAPGAPVYFVDDKKENVAAGTTKGITSFVYETTNDGTKKLTDAFKQNGLIA